MKEKAKIKNNPNLLANKEAKPYREKKTLKTDIQPTDEKKGDSGNEKQEGRHGKSKHCSFHDRPGHDLPGCKTLLAKTLEERTEWIKDACLCFRCFSPTHIASRCNVPLKCTICGDRHHSALLHRERQPTLKSEPKSENEGVNPKCTTLCGLSGGVSCSKTLLVDVYSKRSPHLSKRIYAIINVQSNSSLVTSELADHLGARGPPEKYFLSTCSREIEEKHGRRMPGIAVRSLSGSEFLLPTLTECDTIPQDKSEIPTPDMAKSFPHLIDIAHKIPSPDESTKIQLLISRDAPELLKVREFRNGPRGAPWAQRLALGRPISGQMCLDFPSGPAHVLTRLTSLSTATEKNRETGDEGYELVPCPNQFKVEDPILERATDSIFKTTRSDNEPSLSCEDGLFLEIIETGIHKNESGNWEMPLPFRDKLQTMPNNRRTVLDSEEEYGEEAKRFIHCNFYVDNGLASLPNAQQAIELVKNAQASLATANLRLHKVFSNSVEVMEAFPADNRAKDVRDLDLRHDSLQHSDHLELSGIWRWTPSPLK